jgi:hypothetical protein
MTYRIARGEQGVLTYEPYKSYLLPHWRFRTPPIARSSSSALYQKFLEFYDRGDFVGMDMSRKFIQMGMTRAKRYANYKGGRKYVAGTEKGERLEKSKGHEGKEEKEEASKVFREVWERCKSHEGYKELREEFLRDQREWNMMQKHGDKVTAEGEGNYDSVHQEGNVKTLESSKGKGASKKK